jgi:hypothetical protein
MKTLVSFVFKSATRRKLTDQFHEFIKGVLIFEGRRAYSHLLEVDAALFDVHLKAIIDATYVASSRDICSG